MSSFIKTIRVVKFSAFAVLFSILLSGCSILPQKKTKTDPEASKVVVWSFEEEDIWKPIKQAFEQQNKGYTMVYQKQVFDAEYENRALNSILSSQKPDIWAMPNDWVYRHKEKLYPAPAKLATALDLDNQFVPAIKQSVYFNNNIYALSPSAEPLMIYYNNDLFSRALDEVSQSDKSDEDKRKAYNLLVEPPKTWSDFTEAVRLLTKKKGEKIELSGAALGTSGIFYSQDILYLLMAQNETDIISTDARLATFNLPKQTSVGANDIPGKRAMEFYTSFADPKSDNYSWNDSLGNNIEAFGSGKAAMVFGYSGLQNTLAQRYPNLIYRKAFAPQVNMDSKKIVDLARFSAFAVSAISKAPAASWNLLALLAGDQADNYNSANRLFTSKKYGSEDISVANRTAGNPEKLSLLTARSLVLGRYPSEFDANIANAIVAVNQGTQDAKSALDLAASRSTDLLRKENW